MMADETMLTQATTNFESCFGSFSENTGASEKSKCKLNGSRVSAVPV